MSRLVLAAFAVSLTACFSAHSKQPVTPVARGPASLCATSGPVFVINGVVQPSSCSAAKEDQSPNCDLTTPRYFVNGVPLFVDGGIPTCVRPASSLKDSRR